MVETELINEYEKQVIKITFNADMLQRYTDRYFKFHPKRKKKPLEFLGKRRNGQLYSWNRMINSPNRIMQNTWKQEFSDYTKFILEEQNVPSDKIDKCAILVKQYNQTAQASDTDNISIKATLDSMVAYGIFEDDNYKVVNPVVLHTSHCKENPRSEIYVLPITDQYDLYFIMMYVNRLLK